MLRALKEFETNRRKERQMVGIAKVKAERSVACKGNPASVDTEAICNLLDAGMNPAAVVKKLGTSLVNV